MSPLTRLATRAVYWGLSAAELVYDGYDGAKKLLSRAKKLPSVDDTDPIPLTQRAVDYQQAQIRSATRPRDSTILPPRR